MMYTKIRRYKTIEGAARRVLKLESQLRLVNAKRMERDAKLSIVDGYRVVNYEFGFAVAVIIGDKEYLCT